MQMAEQWTEAQASVRVDLLRFMDFFSQDEIVGKDMCKCVRICMCESHHSYLTQA